MARHAFTATTVLAAATLLLATAGFTGSSTDGKHHKAYIRLDQIGYSPSAPKLAYLISTTPENGKAFRVQTPDGQTVVRGTIGHSIGSVNATYRYVYRLAFGGLSRRGKYKVTAARETSPPFRVARAQALYAAALSNTLSFYENERDGPNFIRSALRTAPGHLNDRHARTYLPPKTNGNGNFRGSLHTLPQFIDAAGGWWDAGDYLKFVETTSYTVDLLLTGIRDFPGEMGSKARRSNFTDEARFGLDWLLHMWDDRTRTMYFQVGIGAGNRHAISDHDIWRLPQADDHYGGRNPLYRYIRHRPVFRAGRPNSPVSPNLAGRDAAAFALCFEVFRAKHAALAVRCLRAAEHVYALANVHPKRLVTAVPHGFYPETEWRDDLELGATELATALTKKPLPSGLPQTNPTYYLRQAASWARAYMAHQHPGDTLNLYDVSGLANYELYRAIQRARSPGKLAVTRAILLQGIHRQLQVAVARARKDPFGAGFPWNSYDTGSHLAGLSVQASEYAALTGSSRYRYWSVHWLDNLLGANAWGVSLIIGDGTIFPHCPQHQVANLVGSLDGSPPVLKGALVEGPNSFAATGFVQHMRRCPKSGSDQFRQFNGHGAVFKDNVQSYSTVEPAIDLTASSPLAFSWQIAARRDRRGQGGRESHAPRRWG